MLHFSPIAVTGIGFVSALGRDPAKVVAAIRKGESGIRRFHFGDGLDILAGLVPDEVFPRHEGDMAADYSLAAARDAWIHSGIGEESADPWRVGTFIGSSKGRLGNLFDHRSMALNPADFPGDTLGLHVARQMGFSGPVLNYPAACATGAHCIIQAAQNLQHGTIDVALAGSGEAGCVPLVLAGFQNMGALSPERTRPFDRSRKGFNPGEGAAVVILERENDARARGARILARLAGWDQRSDAYHITSAEESGATVSHAIERSLTTAGWDAVDVDYINAHGTGTRLNDVVEGRAIRKVFGDEGPLVSSLKPNIGHLLGASSAMELSISLASLLERYVPPTLGLTDPDPDISLRYVSGNDTNTNVCRFLKLSLGFGGHIGVLAVEL